MARLLLRDLTPGTEYKVQLRAVEGDSVSEWSRLFSLTVHNDSDAPDAPAWVEPDGFVVDGDAFVASWQPVNSESNNNKDLRFYELHLSNGTIDKIVKTSDTSYTLSFEQNRAFFGTPSPYVEAKVRSVDTSYNVSGWTSTLTATNPAPAAPTPPEVGNVAEPAADAIMLAWKGPADNDLIGYEVYVGDTTDFAVTPAKRIYSGLADRFTYNSTTYMTQYFKIRAIDKFNQESGDLLASGAPISPFTVDTTPADQPTNLSPSITNNANGVGAIANVTWNQALPADDDLAGFYLRYRKVGDTVWSQASIIADGAYVSGTQYKTRLELQYAYANYEFQIKSVDTFYNESAWTTLVTATSPGAGTPGQTTGVAAVAGRDSIRYTWNASTAANLKDYEITFSTSSTFASGNVTFRTATPVLVVSGLEPGTTYYARVRATNTAGINGAWSATNTKATAAQLTPGDIGAPTVAQFDSTVKTYSSEYSVNGSETVAPTTGWSAATPTRNPGEFIWVRTVVTYQDNTVEYTNPALMTGNDGAQGPQGPQGPQGSQGIQGPAGADGTPRYTWIKYADTPTTGMSDSPTGKKYMGIAYNKTTATESNTYGDYEWSLIKGEDGTDGAQGIQGPPGADGQPTYTWIKYGTSSTGGTISDDPAGKTYIGLAYNKTTATESSNAADYTWSLFQGPQGDQGPQGPQGSQGIQGPQGPNGQTLYTWIKYADTPTTGMSDSPTGKTYMGIAYNKTSSTESNTYSDYEWSLIKGEQGNQGIQGPAGPNGQPTYTWIKYGTSSAGAGLSDSPTGKTYIGIAYNKTTQTESNVATDYEWSLIQGPQGPQGNQGAQGPQGVQGPQGPNGATLYTWLKYADSPTTGMSDSPTGKAYIGLAYNKTTATESNTYGDYTWSLIKGADGADGAQGPQGNQGVQGPPGPDGQPTYTWIKYGTSSAGAGISDDPTGKTYIGLAYNKTTQTESTNAADYTWSLIQGPQGPQGNVGADGPSGPKGDKGADGANGVSVTSITPYYYQIATGSAQPAKPTAATPPSPWTSVEPAYADNTELYRTEKVAFSNGTYTYTNVVKVSAYTAAIDSRVKAVQELKDLWGHADNKLLIDGGDLYARSVNVRSIVLSDFNNYWPDRYFNLSNDPRITGTLDTTNVPPAGGRAVLIQNRDHIGADVVACQPGDSFFMEATYKKITGTADFFIDVWMKKQDGTNVTVVQPYTAIRSIVSDVDLGNGWRRQKTVITVPTGATDCANVSLWLQLSQFSPYTTSVSVSDITWRRRNGGELIVDGSITSKEVASDLFKGKEFIVDTGGAIKSQDFASGSLGWRLDASGLEINKGSVKADAIKAGTLGGSGGSGTINVAVGTSLVLNGGVLKSNTYDTSGGASGFSLSDSGLIIKSGQVSASALTTGTISGTNTITLSGSNAKIVAGSWSLSGSGLSIPNGGIQAGHINITSTLGNDMVAAATTIDGGKIKTGAIQSTSYAEGTTSPRWSIGVNGSATFTGMRVLGNTVLGNSTGDNDSVLASYDFIQGSRGWRIRASGDSEFNNVIIRGTLDGATGTFSGSLSGASGTFTGALSGATGTFSGDVTGGTLRTNYSADNSRIHVATNNIAFETGGQAQTRGYLLKGTSTFDMRIIGVGSYAGIETKFLLDPLNKRIELFPTPNPDITSAVDINGAGLANVSAINNTSSDIKVNIGNGVGRLSSGGNVKFRVGTYATGSAITFNTGWVAATHDTMNAASPSSGNVMDFYCNVLYRTSQQTLSDRREKSNIVDITSLPHFQAVTPLETLNKIRVREFTFNNDSEGKKHFGIIAQELEEVFPHAVSDNGFVADDDPETPEPRKNVSYDDIYALNIAATQELSKENEALKARVESLEAMVQTLWDERNSSQA